MDIVIPDAPRRIAFDWSTSLRSSRSAPTDSHPARRIPPSCALPRWTFPLPTYPYAAHSIGRRAFTRPDPTLLIPTRILPHLSHPASSRGTRTPHFRLVDGCSLISDPLPTWQVPSYSAPSRMSSHHPHATTFPGVHESLLVRGPRPPHKIIPFLLHSTNLLSRSLVNNHLIRYL